MRGLILGVARLIKGADYTIDSRLPLTALLGVSVRRAAALLRSVAHGMPFTGTGTLVFLGRDVELRNRKMIRFGKGVTLGRGVIIDGLSEYGVSFGDCVSIGPYTIIEATGVISNLGSGCSIGANSGIGAFSFIGAAGGVRIGANVIMGQRVSFHSENHNYERLDIPIRMQGGTRQGIVIDDDCWVGANVVFLDGAHVGKGCVIGAGSVVRGDIPPYSVAVGVPVRVVKSRQGSAV